MLMAKSENLHKLIQYLFSHVTEPKPGAIVKHPGVSDLATDVEGSNLARGVEGFETVKMLPNWSTEFERLAQKRKFPCVTVP